MGDDDLSGTVIDGRYQVIEPIAEGAMGAVYRGERLTLGRAVAIKVMHHELPDELASRQRFEREAKLMALLEHPNCVSVIDFGVHDDKPFLVMDLVRGTSLLQVLEKQVQLDVTRAADIIRQVLSGLAHAHELGIVHRDIKPANIMISEKAGLGEQVRILDFGLARLTETSTKLTTGIVVGTPNYMAPEQCKGGDIDARTDLYACGVLLFEMLTGRKPFVADDPLKVVRMHLLEAPPTLGAVEPRIDFGELESVVARALAKAPGDRFESAVEMARAVEEAAAKQAKLSAAALFARAVPETTSGTSGGGNQVATMSGWNVPVTEASSPAAPTTGAASSSTDTPPDTTADPGWTPPPASALPPLPAPGPYVPPPGIGVAPPGIGAPTSLPSAPGAAGTSDVATGSPPATAAPSAAVSAPVTAPAYATPSTPAVSVAPGVASSSAGGGARPIPQLPLTTRQLAIGGGGLLLLVVLVAVIAGGSSETTTTTKKPGTGSAAVVVDTPSAPTDPVPGIIERATSLIAGEDYEGAVALLRKARKEHPDSAEIAFLAGKAYFGQLWWTDGVESFRAAIRLDPAYRENPDLLKTVLKGFLTTPDVDDRIVGFMRHDIGAPLRTYLEETAETHPKKHLRARARAELEAGPD